MRAINPLLNKKNTHNLPPVLKPCVIYSINLKEKPLPQDNDSEVLKALNDQDLPLSGVAGMAELQEDRNESMPHNNLCLPLIFPLEHISSFPFCLIATLENCTLIFKNNFISRRCYFISAI